MSILDRGNTTVTVQPRVVTDGAHGATLTPDGDPVQVAGALQPLSAAESAQFDGTVTFTRYRFICRTWPGDANALVTDQSGRRYDCVGDPQHYSMSRATAHWEVVLNRRADG